MQTIALVDGVLATATQTFFLLLGLWGLFRAVRGQGVDGSYFGALAIGSGMFAIALLLDIVLYFGGIVPSRPGLHYLYAVFAVLLVPFIYASVLRGEDTNQAQWVYAFVTLFLWGVAARLITIGS